LFPRVRPQVCPGTLESLNVRDDCSGVVSYVEEGRSSPAEQEPALSPLKSSRMRGDLEAQMLNRYGAD
jgi:hypothetical protein